MSNTSNTTRPYSPSNIKELLSCAYKSKFVRNVALLASGTTGAQAINIAFSPVITRLYGPEALGMLGAFNAIVSVVTPIAALSFPIAIVLPKTDNDAKGIARLSAYLSLGIAGFLFLALLATGDWLIETLSIQELGSLIFLIPLTVLLSAFMQIIQQWLIRKKQFAITARVEVLQAFIVNSAKTVIGLFKPVAAVLILFTTLGCAIHGFMLTIGTKKVARQYQHEDKPYSRTSLLKLAKKYYHFPLYRSPQVFINAASKSIPILMLAAYFGSASAGFYAICIKVLGMPTQLIGKSVGDVFYPRINEASHNGENLTRLIFKATIGLAAVGFVPFALIVAFGPLFFGFVFGADWVVAGEFARWLSIMMFFFFINRPSVVAIPVLGLQKGFLIYELFSTGSKLIVIYFGVILFKDDKVAIALFSIFGAIAYISLITWVIISSIFFCKKNQG